MSTIYNIYAKIHQYISKYIRRGGGIPYPLVENSPLPRKVYPAYL